MDEESFINLLGVDWKREGGLFKICCPFHHDTHPSLVVYPQDRGYCCYPCSRTGSWQELYKEIKDCDWREAYEVLEIDGDYHTERQPTPRFDFVDPEPEHITKAIVERYEQCLPLDSPHAAPARAFLEKKHLLEQAKELGWRWDVGHFVQSRPRGALVIPYREEGEVVSCRLRTLEEKGTLSKPKTLKGTHARPFALTRDSKILYICEGETDALSLYASGCSVVAVPGAGQKKCINTAVLYATLLNADMVVACGDNDGPGQKMNELVEQAVAALADASFDTLPASALGGLNDINDAYVAGKLKLYDPLAGATPLPPLEALYATALFSTPEEIYKLINDTIATLTLTDEEETFVSELYTSDLQAMQKAWLRYPHLQAKFVYLKDALKLALE